MLSRRQALAAPLVVGFAASARRSFAATDRRAAFLGEVRRVMAAERIPGLAVAIVEDGEITVAQGFGVRSAEAPDPVDADTLFRPGSIGKSFTALTALRLVDAGKLALDEAASARLPFFKADPRITARHLLSHTAGFGDFTAPEYSGAGDPPTLSEYVASLTTVGWEPGRWFSYSNAGFAAAGALIRAAGGASFESQAQAALVAMGLERASFDLGAAMTQPHTVGHRLREGRPEVVRPEPLHVYGQDAAAGAGLFASARDLGRFAQWLLRSHGNVVSAAGVAEMRRAVSGLPPLGYSYGLGLRLDRSRGELVTGHGGNILGYTATVHVAPERGFGLAILANMEGSAADRLLDLGLHQLAGLSPAKASPASRLPEHLGRFEQRSPLGELRQHEVVAVGDGVALRRRDGSLGDAEAPFRKDVYRTASGLYRVYLRDSSGRVVGTNRGSRHWMKPAGRGSGT